MQNYYYRTVLYVFSLEEGNSNLDVLLISTCYS